MHVVEGDACTFVLPEGSEAANLVTFSYALSMIPNFIGAVDQSLKLLAEDGIIGVCDFHVSAKSVSCSFGHDSGHRYDSKSRQMSWFRRFFWQMIFDLDGIYLGSERRLYLDNRFHRVWEENGNGPIPYVPFLRAPWYAWIGKRLPATS